MLDRVVCSREQFSFQICDFKVMMVAEDTELQTDGDVILHLTY